MTLARIFQIYVRNYLKCENSTMEECGSNFFYRFLFKEEADNINDSNKEGINTRKSSLPFSFSSLRADIVLEMRKHVFLKFY